MMNCSCINTMFHKYDYNNIPIDLSIFKNHNNRDNAWISIDDNVYSIQKDDSLLLDIFKDLYGRNVKNFLMNNSIFDNKSRIVILEKLKDRKIGYIYKSS